MFAYKILSVILSFTLCSNLFFLPAAFAKEISKDTHVGIFIFRLDDTYIRSVSEAIEKQLQGKVKFTVFDAQQDHVLQLNQLATFLKEGGDAVAMNLVDVKAGQNVLNMIRDKEIPVVFFNKEPDLNIIKKYAKARYVGSAAEQSGILQGAIIAGIWYKNPEVDRNKDGICQFIMLQGNIDNPEAIVRSKLSVQSARMGGVNMRQIGNTIVCDWDEICAYEHTKVTLGIHMDEVDFIIANNDSMALGAIKALQEYTYNTKGSGKSIPVVGIDGTKAAKEAIAQGIMHGTIIQDAQGMGKAIATMLLNTLAEKDYLNGLPYSFEDNGIAIRIPYQAYGN